MVSVLINSESDTFKIPQTTFESSYIYVLYSSHLHLRRSCSIYVLYSAVVAWLMNAHTLYLSVNLAVALALKCEMKVGLLDADVYGPSIPTLMKLQGKPAVDSGLFC